MAWSETQAQWSPWLGPRHKLICRTRVHTLPACHDTCTSPEVMDLRAKKAQPVHDHLLWRGCTSDASDDNIPSTCKDVRTIPSARYLLPSTFYLVLSTLHLSTTAYPPHTARGSSRPKSWMNSGNARAKPARFSGQCCRDASAGPQQIMAWVLRDFALPPFFYQQ